jgi:hypothetical protein
MAFLDLEERLAVMFAIQELIDLYGSQESVETRVGISQQAISRAANQPKLGPQISRIVCRHLKTTPGDLITKYTPQINDWLIKNPGAAGLSPDFPAPTGSRGLEARDIVPRDEIRELAEEHDWLQVTVENLETNLRAAASRGETVDRMELIRVGNEYDILNRNAQDRRELAKLRSTASSAPKKH